MWRSVGLNVQMQTVENWSQIMERGPGARSARLVELRALQRPGLLARQPAWPNGQQQQIGEWTNAEMNQLCEVLETSTTEISAASPSAACSISASAKDPAYTVLHQKRDLHRQGEGHPLEDRSGLRHGTSSGNYGA